MKPYFMKINISPILRVHCKLEQRFIFIIFIDLEFASNYYSFTRKLNKCSALDAMSGWILFLKLHEKKGREYCNHCESRERKRRCSQPHSINFHLLHNPIKYSQIFPDVEGNIIDRILHSSSFRRLEGKTG